MKRVLQALIVLFILGTFSQAYAAGGGHIPTKMILTQVINLSLVLILLTVLLKKSVRNMFKSREETYTEHLRKVQSAKSEAENKKKEMSQRLNKLEESASKSLESARSEAEELKLKIINDAKTLSSKYEEEARRSAAYEVEKAATHLREELLENAVKLAEKSLFDKMDGDEHKRLHNEFVEKIQVVQR